MTSRDQHQDAAGHRSLAATMAAAWKVVEGSGSEITPAQCASLLFDFAEHLWGRGDDNQALEITTLAFNLVEKAGSPDWVKLVERLDRFAQRLDSMGEQSLAIFVWEKAVRFSSHPVAMGAPSIVVALQNYISALERSGAAEAVIAHYCRELDNQRSEAYSKLDAEFLERCLADGEDGRKRWNNRRRGAPGVEYQLEAVLSLTPEMRNHVKVTLRAPNLWLANLHGANLSGFDLSGAMLSGADLSFADLGGADLSGAHLIATNLLASNLTGADLSRANLLDADLTGCNLTGASLAGAILLRTSVDDLIIKDANIHGVSVWGLRGEPRSQKDLTITSLNEPLITVDDIEIGQFVYLLLHNSKVRNLIDALTSKVVLLLGNFSETRKPILNALRDALRIHNLSPVLFDFDPSKNQDVSDTVTLLARMARFVIADLSDPRCVQQELTMIVPNVLVPIQPIIVSGQKPWAMFGDLQRRSRGILPLVEYQSLEELLTRLPSEIIRPADQRRVELFGGGL